MADSIKTKRPPFPFEVEYLWDWFNEFAFGLKPDGMGAVMASWSDVLDWARLTGVDPEPWETKALVRLANARAAVFSEKPKKAAKR